MFQYCVVCAHFICDWFFPPKYPKFRLKYLSPRNSYCDTVLLVVVSVKNILDSDYCFVELESTGTFLMHVHT
jgi:hypothetical protein